MKSREEELEFYQRHIRDVVFPFWEQHGVDEQVGGFYTCFDNEGSRLLSTDKFTWSQGRMVWVLSTLSRLGLYDEEKQRTLLAWAKSGAKFLMEHCLLPESRCVFLMDRQGSHKLSSGRYDSSMYADCFVILGLSAYAETAQDRESLEFAKRVYDSVLNRYETGRYYTEPYPVPEGWRAHGVPMILTNTSRVLADAMRAMGDDGWYLVSENAYGFACDILDHFVDECGLIHELIPLAGGFDTEAMAGRYINPGHSIEDAWFLLTECRRKNDKKREDIVFSMICRTLQNGWDQEFGGLQLFTDMEGGAPKGSVKGMAQEPMVRKVMEDWGSKLWWPHSEALYATLLAYRLTENAEFAGWYDRIFEYTFSTFPNTVNTAGEWIQIRDRKGKPENRIVALPVKDPFHIMRNLMLIVQLLRLDDAGAQWGRE